MPIFKTTEEIFTRIWDTETKDISYDIADLPRRQEWFYDKNLEISSINLWEQIYYQPAHVGIYAAWDPYAEFYILTYNLFLDKPWGHQIFQGKLALDKIKDVAASLQIGLDTYRVWIDKDLKWLYED